MTPRSTGCPRRCTSANGSATDVPGTGLARRVVYWRDILHEGPVPETPPAELRRVRADYLAGYEGVEHAEALRELTERDQALEANRGGEYVPWRWDDGTETIIGVPGKAGSARLAGQG